MEGRTEPSKKQSAKPKTCFVVSEFGNDDATRLQRQQALRHLVKKVLEPMGYSVRRADDIDDMGQITHQIIERLLDDDLVVADLTGLNPNVFYELAVRHAVRKPVVTLMTHGEKIPFDLQDVRTVFYELGDPDKLEAAQEDLRMKVAAIESSEDAIRNPITVARNVTLLQESDDPEVKISGELLAEIANLRDEIRSVSQRLPDPYSALREPGSMISRSADDELTSILDAADFRWYRMSIDGKTIEVGASESPTPRLATKLARFEARHGVEIRFVTT